jgi:hypothetical protein
VIPRYGEYAEARDLGVRRRYRVAGQVWTKKRKKAAVSCMKEKDNSRTEVLLALICRIQK